jgi:hypothetical protein
LKHNTDFVNVYGESEWMADTSTNISNLDNRIDTLEDTVDEMYRCAVSEDDFGRIENIVDEVEVDVKEIKGKIEALIDTYLRMHEGMMELREELAEIRKLIKKGASDECD